MRNAKILLDLCKTWFPSPRPNQNHGLNVIDNKMVLTLMLGDTYQSFEFDESDLGKEPAQLVTELVTMMAALPPVKPRPALWEVPAPSIPDDTA